MVRIRGRINVIYYDLYPPMKLKLLMEEENVTFCTINSSCITSPLKQKVYVFSTINPENLLKPLA